MKPIITLSLGLAVFGINPALAQTTPTTPDQSRLASYEFGVSVPATECNIDGTDRPGDEVYPPSGSKFILIDETPAENDTAVTVSFLKWTNADDKEKYLTFNVEEIPGAPDRDKVFCVDRAVFQRTASRIYRSGWHSIDLAAGVLLLPIKMRLGGSDHSFEFSKDVTLGTVVGPRFRMSDRREVYGSFLAGVGITAVTLDSTNTRGTIRESTDRPAVTLSLGPLLEVNRFQVGAMLGWDLISRPGRSNWEHQGKTWLALGLGYTILSAPSDKPATDQ